MPPTIIANRYQIQDFTTDLIGRGGMGDVYRAVDNQTGQLVAIKHLKTELVLSNPEMLHRFEREAQALRRLNHPNIVTILSNVAENNQHYLIMEYVPGGSLYDLLQQEKQVPIERVLKIALELADALARAHHLEIIHRDIKPANVLLAADGTPRLTDFGVAHIAGLKSITQTGVLTGTYSYLSPEACNGEETDARSDIWAFGVLLYEMLAGRRPFEESQVGAMIYAILTKPAPELTQFRSDVPEALSELIYKMLAKERPQRIGSMRLVGAKLEAIIAALRDDTAAAPPVRFPLTPPEQPAPAIGPRHNLPTPPTPFVGRSHELEELLQSLADPDCRLLSLIGPGGMGKTRLAIEAGVRQGEKFRHGVRFVPLAPLNSPAQIVPAIAEACQFTFFADNDPQEQLLNYLKEKEMLLILDNFEHLLEGADLVSDIIAAAPQVKILVTSREMLNLWEEWSRPIRGMSYPQSEATDQLDRYSAVQLFASRAKRIRTTFDLQSERRQVIRICRLVDGMPLGIELATTWLRTLSPEQIADEIERNLDFLSTTLRNIAPRHRSIRAVFDYSWALLTEQEQAVFRRLSVFQGGIQRPAAAAIAQADLTTLNSLVSKSLLYETSEESLETSHAGGIRFRYYLHDLLKQYAAAKLDELPEDKAKTLARHAAHYSQFLAAQEPALKYNRQQRAALDAIGEEMENIRTAWYWSCQHLNEHPQAADYLRQAATSLNIFLQYRLRSLENANLFAQAAAALKAATHLPEPQRRALIACMEIRQGLYLFRTQHHEESKQLWQHSVAVLDDLLAENDLDAAARHQAEQDRILAQIFLAFHLSRSLGHEAALALLQQAEKAAQRLGDRWALARVMNVQAAFLPDFTATIQQYQQALNIARETGDLIGMSVIMGNLATMLSDTQEVNTLLHEAETIQRDLGNRYLVAHSQYFQGITLIPQGRFAEAQQLLETALSTFQELAAPENIRLVQEYLSDLAWGHGNTSLARHYLEENIRQAQEQGDLEHTIKGMYQLGKLVLAEESSDEARTLYHSALALLPQINRPLARAEALDALGNFALYLGEYELSRHHFTENLALSEQTEDRTGRAWSLRNFGLIAYELGDYAAAEKYLQESLTIHRQVSFPWAQAWLWQDLGLVAAAQGDYLLAEERYRRGLGLAEGVWGTSLNLELMVSWGILLFKLKKMEAAYEHLFATTRHPLFLPMMVKPKFRRKAARLLAELECCLTPETVQEIKERGRTADDLVAGILVSSS